MVFAQYKDVEVTTIEKYKKFADIAQKNFDKNRFNNIKLLCGDALSLVKKMEEKYDFIFIDGNKENYLEYFLHLKQNINNNGMIVVDDIFFHGDVFNEEPKSQKGIGVKRLLEYLKESSYKKTIFPISNGLPVIEGF